MKQTDRTYDIFQETLGAIDVYSVGVALQEIKRVPMADATRLARHAYGIVDEHVPEALAIVIQERLQSLGIPVFLVPSSEVMEYPKPIHVHQAVCLEEGLRVEVAPQISEGVPWTQVVMVSAGRMEMEETVRPSAGFGAPSVMPAEVAGMIFLGTPVSSGTLEPVRPKRKVRRIEKFLFRILFSDPFRSVQVDKEEFNFSGLGKKIQMDTISNMRLTLQEIMDKAPHVLLDQNAAAFMEGDMRSVVDFPTPADFEEYHRWLFHWVNRPRSGPGNREAGS
jgi:hypothetical protein